MSRKPRSWLFGPNGDTFMRYLSLRVGYLGVIFVRSGKWAMSSGHFWNLNELMFRGDSDILKISGVSAFFAFFTFFVEVVFVFDVFTAL